MTTTVKKQPKTPPPYTDKTAILQKLDKCSQRVADSSILRTLKKYGAVELPLDEVRKRLSGLKTPLSREIIAERRKR